MKLKFEKIYKFCFDEKLRQSKVQHIDDMGLRYGDDIQMIAHELKLDIESLAHKILSEESPEQRRQVISLDQIIVTPSSSALPKLPTPTVNEPPLLKH